MTEEKKEEITKSEQNISTPQGETVDKNVENEEVKSQEEFVKKSAAETENNNPESEAALGQKKKRFTGKPTFVRKKTDDSGFIEKVISINRITKVTKGGKKLSFSALVVVGDAKGNVGYCLEKAPEVALAIQKSLRVAKKNMIKVPVLKGTIPHEIIGRCGGATVLLKPASEGTGVIASGSVRAVCDASGIRDILTKCHRSNNPINVVKATVDGLSRLKSHKGGLRTGEEHSVSA
jgi:small subunit ribosomal protein S5